MGDSLGIPQGGDLGFQVGNHRDPRRRVDGWVGCWWKLLETVVYIGVVHEGGGGWVGIVGIDYFVKG